MGSEAEHVKWFKNHRFWFVVASILVTELLLVAAIVMLVRFKHYKVIWFEWWRWLFFFSGDDNSMTLQHCVWHGPASLAYFEGMHQRSETKAMQTFY